MSAKLRNLMQTPKPAIRIHLESGKKTYTTGDAIRGTAQVTAPTDTPFDALDIEFLGTSRTYVERPTSTAVVSGRTGAFHQFLKLTQPGLSEYYPEDGILKAGQTYEFPFVFGIPQQLLPRVCSHAVRTPAVRDAHLILPPSFGDKDLADQPRMPDDMAPNMASVRYGVFVKLAKTKHHDGEPYTVPLASKARRLRVIPSTDELPPVLFGDADGEYVMRKEKSFRKGVLKGKLGTLVMEATQPRSLRTSAHSRVESRATTTATVMLRFDPSDEHAAPPRLGSLGSKLKVTTLFASAARQTFPTKNTVLFDLAQGIHSEQLNLASRCVANVEWVQCTASRPYATERRDSACSVNSVPGDKTPEPSAAYKGNTYYVARLLVPITLPSNKTFVPTFHSCLISRIYQLKLELGLNSTVMGPTMELKIPIQVSSEAHAGDSTPDRDSLDGPSDVEIDVDDVADFFEPRTVRAHSEGYAGRSRVGSLAPTGEDPPPDYSVVQHPRHRSVPVY